MTADTRQPGAGTLPATLGNQSSSGAARTLPPFVLRDRRRLAASPSTDPELDDLRLLCAAERSVVAEMRACQHYQAISPASCRIRQKIRGRTKAEVREKLQALRHEPGAGLGVSATRMVVSCIRDWPDDGPTVRQASTVENYRRLASHAIGKLGVVELEDLTARQVQKALAELSARSLRPLLLSIRLARSLARGNGSAGSR